MTWGERAKCRSVPTELFFPDGKADLAEDARKICESCPVLMDCAKAAYKTGDTFGVRAGFRLWILDERNQLEAMLGHGPTPRRAKARNINCSVCGRRFEDRMNRSRCSMCHDWVPAEPVRQRLNDLRDAGMTNRELVQFTGLPLGSVNGLLYGHHGKVRQHVSRSTAERVFAVDVPAVKS